MTDNEKDPKDKTDDAVDDSWDDASGDDEMNAASDSASSPDADSASASDADSDSDPASDSAADSDPASDPDLDDSDDVHTSATQSDPDPDPDPLPGLPSDYDGEGWGVPWKGGRPDFGSGKPPTDGPLYGVLAEFDSPGALKDGAEVIRDAGFTKWDCYSPFPVHGLDPKMGIKRTILPWVVFGGGLTGLIGGLGLQWWANAFHWPWIVSGKPYFSLPANIPITFETTVLLAGITAFMCVWVLNKLPKPWHPFFRNRRFLKVTDDGFFIGIEAPIRGLIPSPGRDLTDRYLSDLTETQLFSPMPLRPINLLRRLVGRRGR